MSFEPDNPDEPQHQQSVEELLEENTRWLKVIAYLLSDLTGIDHEGIQEDIE